MLAALLVNNEAGAPSVGIVLGPGDMFVTVEGNPTPGVAIQPADAKQIAYQILYLAQVIENGKSEAQQPAGT